MPVVITIWYLLLLPILLPIEFVGDAWHDVTHRIRVHYGSLITNGRMDLAIRRQSRLVFISSSGSVTSLGALLNRGKLYMVKGDYNRACKDLLRIIDMSTDDRYEWLDAHVQLAVIEAARGNYTLALTYIDTLLHTLIGVDSITRNFSTGKYISSRIRTVKSASVRHIIKRLSPLRETCKIYTDKITLDKVIDDALNTCEIHTDDIQRMKSMCHVQLKQYSEAAIVLDLIDDREQSALYWYKAREYATAFERYNQCEDVIHEIPSLYFLHKSIQCTLPNEVLSIISSFLETS